MPVIGKRISKFCKVIKNRAARHSHRTVRRVLARVNAAHASWRRHVGRFAEQRLVRYSKPIGNFRKAGLMIAIEPWVYLRLQMTLGLGIQSSEQRRIKTSFLVASNSPPFPIRSTPPSGFSRPSLAGRFDYGALLGSVRGLHLPHRDDSSLKALATQNSSRSNLAAAGTSSPCQFDASHHNEGL